MIRFYTEDVSYTLKNRRRIRVWVKNVIVAENSKPGNINFIFCSDNYLLALNREYLKHDEYTDILTFDQSDEAGVISGDIYISIARVRENAAHLGQERDNELHRVMIHGILHLLGYRDKNAAKREQMRMKEDECLRKLSSR